MDYQIPQKDHYPTVWYFATAAHVVNQWQFDTNSTYKQDLPVNSSKSRKNFDEFSNRALWYDSQSCTLAKKNKTFDLSIVKHDEKDKEKSVFGAIANKKIKIPELFWSAVDLFKKEPNFDIKENNYKDFAVVEITFESEEIARTITRNFAEKYKVGSNNGIDVFSDPLDPTKTKDNKLNFYSLGYPTSMSKDKLFLKNNWSGRGGKGDVLSDDHKNQFRIPKQDKVKGLISTKHFSEDKHKMSWGKKKYDLFGHFYYTRGTTLGAGASGSVAVDENGKVLGVRAIEGTYSFFEPLRSEEITVGEIKTPKYDLISGSDNQKSSYKKQVQEYLLKNGKKTWLSSLKNWTYTA